MLEINSKKESHNAVRPASLTRTFVFAAASNLIMVILLALLATSAQSAQTVARHHLQVELFPAEQRLQVLDRITFDKHPGDRIMFQLSPRADKMKVRASDQGANFEFNNNELQIDLGAVPQNRKVQVSIGYTATFDDPAPIRPLNADNPGYGVSATISERGSFLLAGSGWYPRWSGGRSNYELTVVAPRGMLAVTAGQSGGHENRGAKTVSKWEVNDPIRGLSLSVGAYIVRQKKAGSITAATYFFKETDHLSEAYLNATVRYLQMYEALFGPYPFDKFAVVENFFPTGYGFPSYTLIGGRVLRLPFIIHTSLGHEIAHCWWGNGVLVDYAAGNWSEALTTYVADYRYKEMKSAESARTYRQQILRNYATLVNADQDFALNQFQSRYNPATKTIGYDKGAMVFHMLRRQLGEDAFWGALRDLYRDRLFKATSWEDMQKAFESRAGHSLETFFDQWVSYKGAPRFYLDGVQTRQTGNKWTVEGRIVQQEPVFSFEIDLALQNRDQTISKTIRVMAKETRFQMISGSRPLTVKADPGSDIFRQLFPDEIPPAINALKNSPSMLVVLAENLEPEIKSATRMLMRSLGVKNFTFIEEDAIDKKEFSQKDILMVGYPQNKAVLAHLPEQVVVRSQSFTLNQNTYDRSTDSFFGVFPHPDRQDRVAALFLPLSSAHAAEVARKVTHYGKYSYLAFQNGSNSDKGFWSTGQSPLEYRWRYDSSTTSQKSATRRYTGVTP